jgi:predicted nucleic acid-binding protein
VNLPASSSVRLMSQRLRKRNITFSDRQHAIVALPYVDVFLTNDDRLYRIIKRVKQRVSFPTAAGMKPDEFEARFL